NDLVVCAIPCLSRDDISYSYVGGVRLTTGFAVRPATRADVPAIADLLLEGFGHEDGGMLRQRAGRRFLERIHALPGRLNGIVVAVDGENVPIGVAGLRTWELTPRFDRAEEQAMFEELGVGSSIVLDLRAAVSEPPPYRPQLTEAYIYSVAVTKAWRGRGVADSILEYLHCRAKDLGKTIALLEVIETNLPARRLYERHGYALVRKRRGLLAWLPFGAPALLLLSKEL
ncbi:MAG TPA: GNAT family N-acetyltransferase, partial [Herpetosiphonaceae bacterium]